MPVGRKLQNVTFSKFDPKIQVYCSKDKKIKKLCLTSRFDIDTISSVFYCDITSNKYLPAFLSLLLTTRNMQYLRNTFLTFQYSVETSL